MFKSIKLFKKLKKNINILKMPFSLYIIPSFYVMRDGSHYSMCWYMKTPSNVWYYCKKFSMELQAHFQMIILTFILCSLSLSLSLSLSSCFGCQGVWWLILVRGTYPSLGIGWLIQLLGSQDWSRVIDLGRWIHACLT